MKNMFKTKRLPFIFLILLIFGLNLSSQEISFPNIEKDTLKKSEQKAPRTTFMAPDAGDHWFISAHGGIGWLRGEESYELKFKDKVKPTFGFSVGKWISPVWGIRFNISGTKLINYTTWKENGSKEWYIGKNGSKALNLRGMTSNTTYLMFPQITDEANKLKAKQFIENNFLNMDDPREGGYTYDIPYINGSLEAILNLTNLFSSYDPHRFFHLNMFGGIGLSHTFKKKERTAINLITQKYGFIGSFRLSDQITIDLEPQVLIVPEIFDYRVGDTNTMDAVFNIMAGITYKFKDRHFYEPKAVCDNQQIKELNEEVNRLRALLTVQNYVVKPTFVYITPEVETRKERAETGTAYLDFPVGKSQILRNFRNNAIELEKINQTISSVIKDRDITPKGIYLKGFASPEGSYSSNKQLAENRVKALRDFIAGTYNLKTDFFTLDAEPEDWSGFKTKILESNARIPSQNEVLLIIDSDDNPDVKERNLRALDRGVPYRYVLNEIFPSLRRTEYRIDYTVRGFSLEESREIIKTRPQYLSLNEMFAVANSYQPGSPEYNEVFDIAVRLYSSDPVANLNAANIAMSKGDLDAAKRYLAKSGNSAEVTHAKGILNLLEGNMDEAKHFLEEALREGIKGAEKNLEELQKKIQN